MPLSGDASTTRLVIGPAGSRRMHGDTESHALIRSAPAFRHAAEGHGGASSGMPVESMPPGRHGPGDRAIVRKPGAFPDID